MTERKVPIKSKSTLLILAIFFSYWSWIYTYKYDAWKFWLNFFLVLLFWWTVLIPIISWVWAIVDASRYDSEILETYYL